MAVRSLFVANLPPGTTVEEIETIFEPYGSVKNVELKRQYCFVLMSTDEEAEKAKDGAHNFDLSGRMFPISTCLLFPSFLFLFFFFFCVFFFLLTAL